MTIQNPQKFCAGLWDWALLDGCFGESKISPTDIDGFVERNGHVLILETKAPEASIPRGQEIMFVNLTKYNAATVLVIWGNTNNPQMMQRWEHGYATRKIEADTGTLRNAVVYWYKRANQGPPTSVVDPFTDHKEGAG